MSDIVREREAARRSNGRFGEQERTGAEVGLSRLEESALRQVTDDARLLQTFAGDLQEAILHESDGLVRIPEEQLQRIARNLLWEHDSWRALVR